VGLIEGDGWFSVSKKGIYVLYEVGISLNIRDIQLLHKIKKWLKAGTISIKGNMATFRIRKKDDLINIILPIFDEFPMLTQKKEDYIRFRALLIQNVILFENVPVYQKPLISYDKEQMDIYALSLINVLYYSS
jgi:ubiquinol-cytochrome c reductase cytochrome b subunit